MKVSMEDKSPTLIYIVVVTVFLLLTGLALISFHSGKQSREADAKAEQLRSALSTAGVVRVPTTDQIVRVLGDDGGALCADPNAALRRSTLYGLITNGAAGPGQRPVIADNRIVKGQLLVIEIYCPQYLKDFQEVVDDLKFADVAKE
jgi:Tfp pilus assembly protein FimT